MRCLYLCLFIFVAGPAPAQDTDASAGMALYQTYCAQCHGDTATGGGPMAEMMSISTPDLTTLAANNDGVFPLERVARQIDGRDRLLAHGGTMPVFGPVFDSAAQVPLQLPTGQPMMVSQPLGDLLAYLDSVQAR